MPISPSLNCFDQAIDGIHLVGGLWRHCEGDNKGGEAKRVGQYWFEVDKRGDRTIPRGTWSQRNDCCIALYPGGRKHTLNPEVYRNDNPDPFRSSLSLAAVQF